MKLKDGFKAMPERPGWAIDRHGALHALTDVLVDDPVSSNGLAASVAGSSDAFHPTPLDWPALLIAGPPEIKFLRHPYLPAGARVWASGPAGCGKSAYWQSEAAILSREGRRVVLIDQENPLPELLRRLERFRPDPEQFKVYHRQDIDLRDPDHVVELQAIAAGAELVILDTFTACWSGIEDDNAALAAFDRDVMQPITNTGTTFVVVDHTGHPQAFVRRGGISAARGASSKGQKADVVLEFKAAAGGFTIEHAKARMGGKLEPPARFRFVDAEDGSLAIVRDQDQVDDRTSHAERLLAIVTAKPNHYTKSQLAELSDLRKQDALKLVGRMIADKTLGPDRPRAHLSLVPDGSEETLL